jgi:hypothetical protein
LPIEKKRELSIAFIAEHGRPAVVAIIVLLLATAP